MMHQLQIIKACPNCGAEMDVTRHPFEKKMMDAVKNDRESVTVFDMFKLTVILRWRGMFGMKVRCPQCGHKWRA